MKKVLVVIVMLLLMNVSYAASEITIIIDSEEVVFTEAYGLPFIDENNRTQVPLRTALEHFGASVDWVAESYTATVSYRDKFIEVPIGESYIIVDGERVYNDTVAQIKEGRTYLPLRVVFESLGAQVSWESETKSVIVDIPSELVVGTEIGQLAANFKSIDQFNKPILLESFKGQTVLLSYYATW
jgi:hypothetical protein